MIFVYSVCLFWNNLKIKLNSITCEFVVAELKLPSWPDFKQKIESQTFSLSKPFTFPVEPVSLDLTEIDELVRKESPSTEAGAQQKTTWNNEISYFCHHVYCSITKTVYLIPYQSSMSAVLAHSRMLFFSSPFVCIIIIISLLEPHESAVELFIRQLRVVLGAVVE